MASSEYSPWTIAESNQPEWRPGEELAASAFLGMVFLYFVDINVSILRVFKKRRGLYFWSLTIAAWGCFINAIGLICKYLIPNSSYLYGFYTICMMGGWSLFAPLQLMVLYSRLHLVNDNPKIRRWVLILILSTLFTVILPTWVVVWPAYNPNPTISSVWSPRDSIVERYTQIVLTLVECFISGVYIWSLLGLMHYKSSLRQRRVMMDLIYVNIICVAFDVLNLLLIYLNQLGLSHPIQVFGYILKLKLEFVVLNQLMAVAARGIRKQTWEERRYFKPTMQDTFTAEATRGDEKPTKGISGDFPSNAMSATMAGPGASGGSMDKHISAPSSTHQPTDSNQHGPSKRMGSERLEDIIDLENHDFGDSPDLDVSEFVEGAQHSNNLPSRPNRSLDASNPRHDSESTRHDSSDTNAIRSTFSGETLGARGHKGRKDSGGSTSSDSSRPREHSLHLTPARGSNNNSNKNDTIASKARSAMQSFLQPFSLQQHNTNQPSHNDNTNPDYASNPAPEYYDWHTRRLRQQQQMGGHEAEENAMRRRQQQQQRQGSSNGSSGKEQPIKATLRKHKPYSKKRTGEEDEEEEEEIGVHMWEKGSGEVVLDVPWFKSKIDGDDEKRVEGVKE